MLPQRFPLMPSLPLATELTLTWSMTPPVFTLLGMSFYYKVLLNQSFAKLVRAFLSQEWKSHFVQYDFRSVGSRISLPKQAFPQTCSCPTADPEANHDPPAGGMAWRCLSRGSRPNPECHLGAWRSMPLGFKASNCPSPIPISF